MYCSSRWKYNRYMGTWNNSDDKITITNTSGATTDAEGNTTYAEETGTGIELKS